MNKQFFFALFVLVGCGPSNSSFVTEQDQATPSLNLSDVVWGTTNRVSFVVNNLASDGAYRAITLTKKDQTYDGVLLITTKSRGNGQLTRTPRDLAKSLSCKNDAQAAVATCITSNRRSQVRIEIKKNQMGNYDLTLFTKNRRDRETKEELLKNASLSLPAPRRETNGASTIIACQAVKLLSKYFDSFSPEEYPEVTYTIDNAQQQVVKIGFNVYKDGNDNVSIEQKPSFGFRKIVQVDNGVKDEGWYEKITIWAENGAGEVSLTYLKEGETKPVTKKVALLKCK